MPDDSAPIRILFWNTWLLAPRIFGAVRFPFGEKLFAPDVARRAPLVGRAVGGRFDAVALAECFEASEQDAVASAWPDAVATPGPGRLGLRPTASGLLTLTDPSTVEVVKVARLHYRAGGDLRDSDTFASKGALLTRLRTADGAELDLISTHLIAGGDLFPIPGHDDQVRHHRARMAQLEELLAFAEAERDPSLPLLLVGDFNVAVDDPDPDLADPRARYRELADRVAAAGFEDLWATHGVGPGHTCTFTDPDQLPPDPDEPDQVADDPDADPPTAPGERLDLLLLHVPDGAVVTVGRPRRWAFPGRAARGGRAGSLSDHLAVSVALHLG